MLETTHTASHTILVIEEDNALRAFLADQLTADGYTVYDTANLERALGLCATQMPDAALVDVNGGSGRSFATTVRGDDGRSVDPRLPLILLGSVPGELEALRAFDAGADDYVVKPLSYVELRARLRALLRRVDMHSRRAATITVGTLRIDLSARRVSIADEPVALSNKEFALLRILASDPTRVFAKDELLRSIWGYRSAGRTRTLDSHVCRLRRKLVTEGERYVVCVWGVGYRLIDGPPSRTDRGALEAGSMRRSRMRRSTPLRRGRPPQRRTPLKRTTPLARKPFAPASAAQRAKVAGRRCLVCSAAMRIDPAHLVPRSLGGCDDALCVVALCRTCHRRYDRGQLDLVAYLEPGHRAEAAHAVQHVGLAGALRRISGKRG